MKRLFKWAAVIWCVAVLAGALYLIVAFFGNPVSMTLCDRAAKAYLAEQYGDHDVLIDKTGYNFKDGNYYARVSSPTSIDTHFSIYMTGLGQVRYDTYDSVTDGWNTFQRLESAYRAKVNALFDAEGFELRNDIAFGTLETDTGSEFDYKPVPYGIKMEELVIDGVYDEDEIARTAGHIIFYMQDEDVSFETAARSMLRLKEILTESGIPFFAMDFVLRLPREEGQPGAGGPTIHVTNFLSSDIVEDGMVGRVRAAHEALEAHYARLDAQK